MYVVMHACLIMLAVEPAVVPLVGRGAVKVSGRSFPRTIGGSPVVVKCMFGTYITTGWYDSSSSVICPLPLVDTDVSLVLTVSIDGGHSSTSSSVIVHVCGTVNCVIL